MFQQVWKKWEDLRPIALACNLTTPDAAPLSQIQATIQYCHQVQSQPALAPLAQQLLSPSVKHMQGELKTFVQILQQQIEALQNVWTAIQTLGGIEHELFLLMLSLLPSKSGTSCAQELKNACSIQTN